MSTAAITMRMDRPMATPITICWMKRPMPTQEPGWIAAWVLGIALAIAKVMATPMASRMRLGTAWLLMMGAVLKPAYVADIGTLLDLAADKQVLILQAGTSVLRFVPPLNITDDELAEGLKRVREAIAAYVAAR